MHVTTNPYYHMLMVAINNDTQLTLSLSILLPSFCAFDLGLALHTDLDVEDGSCNYAKEKDFCFCF